MSEYQQMEADVIVVGSGPGGATVAREMSKAGKRVLLLEYGKDMRQKFYYGTYLGALLYTDRASFLFSKEGVNIIRPLLTGGATNMFCASAAEPPAWLKAEYGIDLAPYVQETITEIGIAPLPPDLRGRGSTRLADAAADLGLEWHPQPKMMNPARAHDFNCGAHCMLGCRCGAKWTANEYIDEAVAAGCQLVTQARVEKLCIEDGQATGVMGKVAGRKPFVARGEVVVLAAGGIGSPLILRQSGFPEAGQGLALDSTLMVYGQSDITGFGHEPPMTYGYEDLEHGFMLSTLIDPWLLYPLIMARKGLRYALTWPRWQRSLGVMIKIHDEVAGQIVDVHDIRKPVSDQDRQKFERAIAISRQILIKAGCDSDTILSTPVRGTHPSATVRLGEMLDENLETRVKNLFVCDASTFPKALGRPTVLTIIGLAKRLSQHLVTQVFQMPTHQYQP